MVGRPGAVDFLEAADAARDFDAEEAEDAEDSDTTACPSEAGCRV